MESKFCSPFQMLFYISLIGFQVMERFISYSHIHSPGNIALITMSLAINAPGRGGGGPAEGALSGVGGLWSQYSLLLVLIFLLIVPIIVLQSPPYNSACCW